MADAPKSTKKEVEFEGYKFNVDTDLLDDVEAFEIVDRIENRGQVAAIVPLLNFVIGPAEYEKMKAHFKAADAEEHKGEEGYRPKFRASKLSGIYTAIVQNFDPKD